MYAAQPLLYALYAEFTRGGVIIQIYQQEFVLDVTSEKN